MTLPFDPRVRGVTAPDFSQIDFSQLPRLNVQQPGALSSGVRSGWNTLQAMGGAGVAAVGKAIGVEPISRWGEEAYRNQSAEAEATGRSDLEGNPFREGGPSVLPWAGYQFAKQVPQIAASLLAARAGARFLPALPASVARIGAVAPRLGGFGGGALEAGASFAERRAALVAGERFVKGLAGATAVGVAPGVGAMYGEAIDRGNPTRADAVKAIAMGVPYAMLDAAEPVQLSNLLEKGLKGNLLKRVATAGAVGAAMEVPQEALQTAMELSFRPDIAPIDKMRQIVDAAVTGGVVGGMFGGLGGVRRLHGVAPSDVTNDTMKETVDGEVAPAPQAPQAPQAPAPIPGVDPTIPGVTAPAPTEQGDLFPAPLQQGPVPAAPQPALPEQPDLLAEQERAREQMRQLARSAIGRMTPFVKNLTATNPVELVTQVEQALTTKPSADVSRIAQMLGMIDEKGQPRDLDADFAKVKQRMFDVAAKAKTDPRAQAQITGLLMEAEKIKQQRDILREVAARRTAQPTAETPFVPSEPTPEEEQAANQTNMREIAAQIVGRRTQFTAKLKATNEVELADLVLARLEKGSAADDTMLLGQHFGFIDEKGNARDLVAELRAAQAQNNQELATRLQEQIDVIDAVRARRTPAAPPTTPEVVSAPAPAVPQEGSRNAGPQQESRPTGELLQVLEEGRPQEVVQEVAPTVRQEEVAPSVAVLPPSKEIAPAAPRTPLEQLQLAMKELKAVQRTGNQELVKAARVRVQELQKLVAPEEAATRAKNVAVQRRPKPLHEQPEWIARIARDLRADVVYADDQTALIRGKTRDGSDVYRAVNRRTGKQIDLDNVESAQAHFTPAQYDALKTERDLAQTTQKSTPGANVPKLQKMLAKVVESPTSASDATSAPNVPARDAEETSTKAKPGANIARLAGMLGPKLYGDMSTMGETTVKELMQNAVDAVKGSMEHGQMSGDARVDIDVDENARTVTVRDNGPGMTPHTINTAFLTLAGTEKQSSRSSGGFGIAKMLFLFGSDRLQLRTTKNGQTHTLDTTGAQLLQSLDDPSQAPNIESRPAGPDEVGTTVVVTIPETYTNPNTGEKRSIRLPQSYDEAIEHSPIFDPINVTFNKRNQPIGKRFKADDYTTFANVKFDGGNARIIVSKRERPQYGKNVAVLSNGLLQFRTSINATPTELVPRQFYINIEPTVRPEDPGYPFDLNRKGFAAGTAEDFSKIFKYLSVMYAGSKTADQAKGFGQLSYVSPSGKFTKGESLVPNLPKARTLDINEGDEINIVDGKMMVNGKVIKELTPRDLKDAQINLDEFQIPQDRIDATRPMVHDNMVVNRTPEYPEGASLSEAATAIFGDRYGQYVHTIGTIFMDVRDTVSFLGGKRYEALGDIGVGVSYDKDYHGVHITVPFRAAFVNPAVLKGDTPAKQALGMYHTMMHELAHFHQSGHDARFWAEDDELRTLLEVENADKSLKNRIVVALQRYKDISEYLTGEAKYAQSIGKQFIHSEYERTRPDGDMGERVSKDGVDQGTDAGRAGYQSVAGTAGGAQGDQRAGGRSAGTAAQGAESASVSGRDGPLGNVGTVPDVNTALQTVTKAKTQLLEKMTGRKDLKIGTRRALLGMMSMNHLVRQYGHHFKTSEGNGMVDLTDTHAERNTIHAQLAQISVNARDAYDRLEKAKPKAAKLTTELMAASEFDIDPHKTWEQHTWLHDSPNKNLQRLVGEYNDKLRSLKQMKSDQVYEDFRASNDMIYRAHHAAALFNMVASDPVLSKANITGFEKDPMDAFREQSALHRSPQDAQAYWRTALFAQLQGIDDYVATQRGGMAAATGPQQAEIHRRISPLERAASQTRSQLDQIERAPYFHLGRHGNFIVEFDLRKLADGTVDPTAMDYIATQLEDLKFPQAMVSRDSTRSHVFLRVENASQQDALREAAIKWKKQGWLKPDSEIRIDDRSKEPSVHRVAPEWLNRYIESLRSAPEFQPTDDMSNAERAEMEQTLDKMVSNARTLWLDMLPDMSIQKVLTRRNATPGYSKDMVRNFSTRQQIGVGALANLSTAPKITDAMAKIRTAVNDASVNESLSHEDITTMQHVLGEVSRRETERPLRSGTNAIDTWRAVNHSFFLGASPAYMAVNLTQLGTMLWPELAKQHGFAKSARAIGKVTSTAFKIMSETFKAGARLGPGRVADAIITEEVLKKAGIAPATAEFVMRAVNTGNIDIGSASRELGRAAEGKLDSKLDSALRFGSAAGYYSETFTRLVAALAARELHGDSDKASLDRYVKDTVNDAMLNYSDSNKARYTGKMGLAGQMSPVMFSFMQYQLQVTEKLYRELHTAFFNAAKSDKEKEAARAFLGAHLAAMTVLTGTLGMPFASVAARVLEKTMDLWDDDDEPHDVKAMWRNYLAEMFGKGVGEMLARGVPRGLGIDIASRAGEQDLLPFSRLLTDHRRWQDASRDWESQLMGAPVSMVMSVLGGAGRVAQGDVLGGMQEMMPVAIKGPLKAYQMSRDGYVDNTGNKMPMTPGALDMLAQAVGFTPSERAEYSEAKLTQGNRQKDLTQKASLLRRNLALAVERGDRELFSKWMTDARAFDAKHPSYAVLPGVAGAIQGRARARATADVLNLPLGTKTTDVQARSLTGFANFTGNPP